MAKDLIIETVTKLSQEEGLNDSEIGSRLGYARGSIQRIRRENNIPTANFKNRKDKNCKCVKCQNGFMIKRSEVFKALCPNCEDQVNKAFDNILKQ